MKTYIQPVTACIRLNLSSQVLGDIPIGNGSQGGKKEDAWAKGQAPFDDWGDEDEGITTKTPRVKWEEE